MAQTLGILTLSWRQEDLDIDEGGKVKLGGYKNTLVKTGRRAHRAVGFEESEITAKMPLEKARQLKALFDAGEGELIAKCDTGQTYSWPDAFLVNRPEFTAGKGGEVELKWNAGEPEELVS